MQMLPNWVGRGGEVAIGKGEAWCRGFGVSAVLSLDQDGGLRAASGCANPLRDDGTLDSFGVVKLTGAAVSHVQCVTTL